jgi:hypothetical protein
MFIVEFAGGAGAAVVVVVTFVGGAVLSGALVGAG